MWAAWCPEKGDNMLDNWNRPKRPVDAEIDEGVEEAIYRYRSRRRSFRCLLCWRAGMRQAREVCWERL